MLEEDRERILAVRRSLDKFERNLKNKVERVLEGIREEQK
jgi:hypothetical protein